MKISILVLASFLAAGASHAASISCTGSMLDYTFSVKAKTSGAKVGGSASVVAMKGRALVSKGSLRVVSSQFEANKSLSFDAAGGPNRVTVNTSFVSPGRYDGTLALSGQEGSTNVATVCMVR